MENNKIVQFNKKRQEKKSTPGINKQQGFSFSAEVDKDIQNLMKATGLDKDDAFSLAKDFYRKYPMLMEFIRTPNEILRR